MRHGFGGSVYLQGRHTFGLLAGLVASASLHLVLIFAGLSPLLSEGLTQTRRDRLLVELRSQLPDSRLVSSELDTQIEKPPSQQGSQSMEPPAIKSGQLIKSTGPMATGSEPPKIPDTRRAPDEKPPAVSEIASSSQRKLDAYPDYRAVGLDPQPYPLHEINPAYPQHAGSLEGSVVLRLLINERGIVDDAVVVSSFPKDVFDESAVMAFRSALFSPGMFLGMPVKSQLTIEVEFLPTNRGAGVSGRGY